MNCPTREYLLPMLGTRGYRYGTLNVHVGNLKMSSHRSEMKCIHLSSIMKYHQFNVSLETALEERIKLFACPILNKKLMYSEQLVGNVTNND